MITFERLKAAIFSSVIAAVLPNKASATTNGPIEVPNEFTPPPRFTRLVPVAGSPRVMAKGCAAVCCNQKPSATMNKPINIPAKLFALTATIMAAAPKAENKRP